MSDFSALEQSFALSAAVPLMDDPPAHDVPLAWTQVQPDEVSYRRVRGPHEIAHVLHLREELRLSATALADASFAAREKKETRWESSARSSASARPSVPSASCP